MFVLRLRRPGADLEASEGRWKNLKESQNGTSPHYYKCS